MGAGKYRTVNSSGNPYDVALMHVENSATDTNHLDGGLDGDHFCPPIEKWTAAASSSRCS
jgi:hypothetical protein